VVQTLTWPTATVRRETVRDAVPFLIVPRDAARSMSGIAATKASFAAAASLRPMAVRTFLTAVHGALAGLVAGLVLDALAVLLLGRLDVGHFGLLLRA